MSQQIYIFRQGYSKVKKPKVSIINQPLSVYNINPLGKTPGITQRQLDFKELPDSQPNGCRRAKRNASIKRAFHIWFIDTVALLLCFFLKSLFLLLQVWSKAGTKPFLIVKETVMDLKFLFLHNGVRRFDEPYSKPTKTVMSYWFCTLMDQSERNLYHFLWHLHFNVQVKKMRWLEISCTKMKL